MNNIGEIFRQMRKSAGYTQKELGEKLGYSQAKISDYEANKVSPVFSTIQRWAETCGCEVVLEWKEKHKTPK